MTGFETQPIRTQVVIGNVQFGRVLSLSKQYYPIRCLFDGGEERYADKACKGRNREL